MKNLSVNFRIGFVVFFIFVLIFLNNYIDNAESKKLVTPSISPQKEIKAVAKITPTEIPYFSPTPPWGQEIKIDEHTSASYFGADDRMATPSELFDALNNYRKERNLSVLQQNDEICNIAQSRANELKALGDLDSHAGLPKFQSQTLFINEVLFGGNAPLLAVHIVEWGWDKSLVGHKQVISNPKWQYGCAGISNYFAVFVFGAK